MNYLLVKVGGGKNALLINDFDTSVIGGVD